MPTREGQRTARDLMIDGMNNQNIEEVPNVRFELQDGRIVNASGENHPAYDLPANQIKSMSFHPSAEGA